MSLRETIEQVIRAQGPIPFSRFMELCLYDPELGYYSRDTEKFGRAGDFYTSSDVHAVFGRLRGAVLGLRAGFPARDGRHDDDAAAFGLPHVRDGRPNRPHRVEGV